jgi:ABC-type branched-subunit amino acid transport system ATPase component/branched-subunit amino acid ABC-type transport system permease component
VTAVEIRSTAAERIARWSEHPDVRYGASLAAGVLAFLTFVAVLYPAPLAVLLLGAVLGSLSSLVAMGLVLVYRANRIINFAQGELGAVAAILTASLIVGPGWSFFPAVAVGLVTALLLGAVTEVLIIRRFATAPRLILTVATIGIAQIFAFLELGLPKLFSYDVVPQPPVPFDFRFTALEPVVFNGGHLLILIVVPIVTVALGAFFRYTRIGVAVRASAERADRAALLGIPVKRVSTVVWIIAGGLSGLGVLLRLPIQGVAIGAVLGPSLLLRALAAGVVGRMEKLPVAFAAALGIGMLEQAVLYRTGRTLIVDGVLFFIILVGLLVQRRGATSRADDMDVSTWTATKEVRPIPRELRRDPIVRFGLLALGVIAAGLLLWVPLTMPGSRVNLVSIGLILSMIAVSLAVLTGWAGQISLGQMSFAAFGAAVAGTMAQNGHHFIVTLIAAGLVGALVAVLIGIPALRMKGLFLAVTTLAFALATGSFFINREFFPWLVPDTAVRIVRPVLFGKYDLESDHVFYYTLLFAFALVVGSVRSLRNSRSGRVLVATRDNARAAQSYGVSPIRARITAFALSGFIAAMAGGFFVYHQYDVPRSLTQVESSLVIFSMAVIGGLGSIPGAVLGAAYLTFLDFSPFTRQPLSRLLASGVGMLLILLFVPSGLGGILYNLRDAVLRRIARARGIVVPSLLADVRVDDGETPAAPVAKRTENTAPTPDDSLLVVRGLDVSYGKTQVLFGVDMHVERGEIVALLGTNGAGKSTLLSAISGLVPAGRGTVHYDGHDITRREPVSTVAEGLVFMPGGKGVFPSLTVEENLALAGWLFDKKDPEHVKRATEEVLEAFPILRRRWAQKAGNLSGGEQQMLTLGQALIARPKLLMIDELSLGLAPVIVEQLLGIVRALHAAGTTIVLVEQSVNVAITLAQRAIFMEKGEVRFDGPTADLLDRPDILRAVFLKGASAATGSAAVPRTREAFVAQCSHCGHEHRPALEVDDLAVRFGGVRAVDGVSFSVREGEILGIIGPNGAGKTTVFDLVSGYLAPSDGRIRLLGTDVTLLPPEGRANLGLGRSFQDARLFPSMTVRQTIAVALERHILHRDPIATALMSGAVRHAEKLVEVEVDRLIELMRLQAFADKFVGELSTGTRRMVDLACVLAHDPKVLLLDEPSSGIAQRETEALGPALLDIRDQTGAALVVIEHDMPLITSISDELLALELGAVVARGRPDEVINDPRVIEGYLGGSEDVIFRSGAGRSTRAAANGAADGARRRRRARSAERTDLDGEPTIDAEAVLR